ncbi:DGQHR domain-containing protein [Defluviimonas sp. WL0002]|uniref:DGQHR domain-containing protein n=1 Tax=Albidovulum marisflavi TaxID=2984159 RepID=A0ABT2ZGU3_9RHOB|nr:DGQHR domain-containing protein [Defluviimonas sp. WL0002]MCV2870368.1 DGQHR domain-containing protein [Defluviimonas sp. WL0002]
MTALNLPCIRLEQHGRPFFLLNMPAELVVKISYAAIRGKDKEQGAVQRVLNSRRISRIKDFALSGGSFPNSIVMNWVEEGGLTYDPQSGSVSFDPKPRLAQLIDGQHRVAGLAEAMEANEELKRLDLPVAVYSNLTTQECADIFLAINTEQKPVHRSLVFDLYAIADEQMIDPAAARARDIALELSDVGAPYHGMIKFPGEAPRKGGVALSTVVTSIKPLIEQNGAFDQVALSTLENQSRVIINFFSALQQLYGELWFERQNAFMFAAGFSGALDFLASRLLPYCVTKKSFRTEVIVEALSMTSEDLILQKEVSGRSGSEAQSYIFSRLDDFFDKGDVADEYDF